MLGKNLSYHNDARRPERNVMDIFVRDNTVGMQQIELARFNSLETWLESSVSAFTLKGNTELCFRISLKRLTPTDRSLACPKSLPKKLSYFCINYFSSDL